MELRQVSLAEIDIGDERFHTSAASPYDGVLRSIEEVGLLSPPIVTRRGDKLIPVTGWKRIHACRRLGLSLFAVFVSEERDDLKTFRLAIHDNLSTRSVELIELSEIIKRLIKFGEPEKRIIQNYLPLFDVPPTRYYCELFKRIARLSRKDKNWAYRKKLKLPVIEQLVRFSAKERQQLIPLLDPLGQNKQKELLELVKELCLKNRTAVDDILNESDLQNILESENLSDLQKAEFTRALLKKRRFPLLSDREKDFHMVQKNIGWPKDMPISYTPAFEDSDLHIDFNFSNRDDYIKKLERLRKLAEREEFLLFFKSISDD